MLNSTYNPESVNFFEKSKLSFNGRKIKALVPAGSIVNIDFPLIEDHLLTGAVGDFIGGDVDDEIQLSIVHPVAGVLASFIDWFARDFNKELPYPAKIPGGLIIRLTYKSTGINDVSVHINYSLHKVLV